jgi:hypothetical protein
LKWDPRNGPEIHVDEALHAQILFTLSKNFPKTTTTAPRTLVLVTGDGNRNSNSCSFPDCVELALRRGWYVELWAWRKGTSKVSRVLYIFLCE